MKLYRRQVVALLLTLCSLQSCYHEEVFDPEIVVRPAKDFAYELQVHSHNRGRGNPHDPFDFKTHEWESYTWIYANRLQGRVKAADIVLTHYWGCHDSPWIVRELRGYIEFRTEDVILALEIPVYEDGIHVSRHVPMKANGTYKVTKLNEPLEPSAKEVRRDLEVAPCKR